MDVIVLGKEGFKASEAPQLIYCGQSRTEARDAITAARGKFKRIYEVNPLPFRSYKASALDAPEAVAAPEVPEQKQTTEPTKKQKFK